MMRLAALLWLMAVALAGIYLLERLDQGLHFRTDLLALLPQEERDPVVQRANDVVTRSLSRHVIVLVGDKDRNIARTAATDIAHQMAGSGLVDINTNSFDKDRLKQIGTFYFPYRAGLLADDDRELLKTGQGEQIATRALSQVYGVMGFANAKLLHDDPFLLMPAFLTGLPIPLSRLSLDEGMLSLRDDGTTWVLIAGQLKGEPFAIDVQKKVSGNFDAAANSQRAGHLGLTILHLGAVFFAKAGAEEAMRETTSIGIISTAGIVLLVMAMFRAIRPLLLSLLVIGVGVMMALSVSLWIFGELHVGALLFGVSLIGVAVDYSLQYCSEVFAPAPGPPHERLRRVGSGVTLGATTTVIGYLTLFLAPFPGLHQIAAFSAVGLVAAWITVMVWLPFLDRKIITLHGQPLLSQCRKFLDFWQELRYRKLRIGLFCFVALFGIAGYMFFHTDDDVHRLQPLSSGLVAEQVRIQNLIGASTGSQFFLVQAHDDETALQHEETLVERLKPLVASGALAGFQAPSQYIPSADRQKKNRILQRGQLYKPLLTSQTDKLGLQDAPTMLDEDSAPLTLADVSKAGGSLTFLSSLVLSENDGEITHVIALDGIAQLDEVAAAAAGIPGIRFVDPVGNFSTLLGKYRLRAIELLALSALLMAPLLVWRYGWRKGLWIMVPPMLAVILAPSLRALTGGVFTFFDAMALVLILSIGVDYAVFCAETSGTRKPVTILAVAMAACTALMSFGLLVLSNVEAVHNFGATMTVGILLSFLFAPMACSVHGKDGQ